MLGEITLDELLAAARRLAASDLHLASNERPAFRCDGTLRFLDASVLSQHEFEQICACLFGNTLLQSNPCDDLDRTIEYRTFGRLRVHAFRSQGQWQIAIRLLAARIAEAHELGLPESVIALFGQEQLQAGLVLIAGATGQGKTTVLATLLEHINCTRHVHIVTIEDPIEYCFQSQLAHISQRELGSDIASFAAGIHAAMRMDPDIIAIGELREPLAIAAALRAAETGHLVFATVHSADCVSALERLIDAFDEGKSTIRHTLASALRAVLSLRLLPRKNAPGRVLASELLVATDSIRSHIREQKTHQVRNAILTGRAHGMYTFESTLRQLFRQGAIDEQQARNASTFPDELSQQTVLR